MNKDDTPLTAEEIHEGMIDIQRRNVADWFARKHIPDELHAECPPLAEWCRDFLRSCITKEYRIVDVVSGKKGSQ